MKTMFRAVPAKLASAAATAAAAAAVAATVLLAGCTPTVKVKHEVEPIHLTADINIRVDRELDEFFAFQDQAAATQPAGSTTQTARIAEGDVK